MRTTLCVCIAIVVGVGGLARTHESPAPRPISLMDALAIPRVANAMISGNGRKLLYTVTRTDWANNTTVTSLWVTALRNGSPRRFASGADLSGPVWSPDGRQIAFIRTSRRRHSAELCVLTVQGKREMRIPIRQIGPMALTWAPDGKGLYFVAAAQAGNGGPGVAPHSDVLSYGQSSPQLQLWRLSLSAHSARPITDAQSSVVEYTLSSNGRQIAYERAPTPLLNDRGKAELWIMSTTGKNHRRLTHNGVLEVVLSFSPSGQEVLFQAQANERLEPYYQSRAFGVSTKGGAPRVLAGSGGRYDVEHAFWGENSETLYFIANVGSHDAILRSVNGAEPKVLVESRSTFICWQTLGNQFVLTRRDDHGSWDVWIAGVRPDGRLKLRQITHVSDYIRQDFQLGAQKAISWHGADGRPVEGILTLPVGYMRGSRYPLAVLIHGGPAAADHFGIGEWPYLVQVLAGRGYLVLQPNYRGSTGYGDAFMRDVVGHYFNQDYRDIEHGVAALIERGLVLREQVVVFGWSAGAHLTNKLITSTDIFAAAASGAGVADWRSLYAESDLRASRDAVFGGPPWRSPEVGRLYDENSPIEDVSVARTPTILFAGAEDRRIPPAQAVMLYNALRAVGVTTTLYVAPAEGHGWVKPLHRLFQSNAELAWFERFARHRAYAWDWPESGSPASGP